MILSGGRIGFEPPEIRVNEFLPEFEITHSLKCMTVNSAAFKSYIDDGII